MSKIKLFLILIVFILAIPLNAFALNVKDDLPELELPSNMGKNLNRYDLPDIEGLEAPTFSTDFESKMGELETKGFGEFLNGKNGLSLPDVEAPLGAGTLANDLFGSTFGNMYNSGNLDWDSIIPGDLKSEYNNFASQGSDFFSQLQNADKENMAAMLEKTLDTSGTWDFESLKSQLSPRSDSEQQSHLSSTPVSDGWDYTRNKAYEGVQDNSQPKALIPIGELLDSLKGIAGVQSDKGVGQIAMGAR